MFSILKKIFAYLLILINSFTGINLNNDANLVSNRIYVYNNVGVNDSEVSAINCLNRYYVPSINMPDQQRYFKANVIKNINRNIDRITVGSSHMLTIRYDDDKIDHMNFAVGGATLQDRLSIFGLLHYFGIKYNYVNLELDIPSFTTNAFKINTEEKAFDEYAEYFKKVLNDEDVSDFEYADFNKNYVNNYDYMGYNLNYKTKDALSISDKFYYDKEASQHIPYEVDVGNEDYIKQTILNLSFADAELKDMHINKESINTFNKLFDYFEKNDVTINIILVPRSPYVYDSEKMASFPIVNEIMEYAFSLAKNRGISITGSLNPHYINVKDDDYFDAFHLKQKVSNSVFDIRR